MDIARSLLAVVLLSPAAGFAQSQLMGQGRVHGFDLLPNGSTINRAPAFFTFMNSVVAPITADQWLATPRPARGDALEDTEISMRATARRRAAVRILTGYEPVLAFLQELNTVRRGRAQKS